MCCGGLGSTATTHVILRRVMIMTSENNG